MARALVALPLVFSLRRVASRRVVVLLPEADPPSSLSSVTDLGCRRWLRHARFSRRSLPPVPLLASRVVFSPF